MNGMPSSAARFVHPARVVPRVREVLVAEDRDGPPGQADHPADLLEEVAAWVHLASALVGGVVAVLGYDDDSVDGKLADLPSRRGRPVSVHGLS